MLLDAEQRAGRRLQGHDLRRLHLRRRACRHHARARACRQRPPRCFDGGWRRRRHDRIPGPLPGKERRPALLSARRLPAALSRRLVEPLGRLHAPARRARLRAHCPSTRSMPGRSRRRTSSPTPSARPRSSISRRRRRRSTSSPARRQLIEPTALPREPGAVRRKVQGRARALRPDHALPQRQPCRHRAE